MPNNPIMASDLIDLGWGLARACEVDTYRPADIEKLGIRKGLGPVSSAVGMFDPVTMTRSNSAITPVVTCAGTIARAETLGVINRLTPTTATNAV